MVGLLCLLGPRWKLWAQGLIVFGLLGLVKLRGLLWLQSRLVHDVPLGHFWGVLGCMRLCHIILSLIVILLTFIQIEHLDLLALSYSCYLLLYFSELLRSYQDFTVIRRRLLLFEVCFCLFLFWLVILYFDIQNVAIIGKSPGSLLPLLSRRITIIFVL